LLAAAAADMPDNAQGEQAPPSWPAKLE